VELNEKQISRFKASVSTFNTDVESEILSSLSSLPYSSAIDIALEQAEKVVNSMYEHEEVVTWIQIWLDQAKKRDLSDYVHSPFDFYGENRLDESYYGFLQSLGLLNRSINLFNAGDYEGASATLKGGLGQVLATRRLRYWIENDPESRKVYLRTKHEDVTEEEFMIVLLYKHSLKRKIFWRDSLLEVVARIEEVYRGLS